jgi:hypothetical protein
MSLTGVAGLASLVLALLPALAAAGKIDCLSREEFEFSAQPAGGAEGWFGPDAGAEATVIPLGEVEVKTHRELKAEESVRIGGQAALTQRNVLEDSRLPAGRYLLAVTVSGRSNWDRHVLYFEVKEE